MSVHGWKEHVLLLAALLSEGLTPKGHHREEALVTPHLVGALGISESLHGVKALEGYPCCPQQAFHALADFPDKFSHGL